MIRRAAVAAVLAAGLLAAACTPGVAPVMAGPPEAAATAAGSATAAGWGEVRGPFLWSKTVRAPFADVVADVERTVAAHNFPLSAVRDYEHSLGERIRQVGEGQLPFRHYRILEYCNVALAMGALAADLRMGIFMPCRMVIYQPLDSAEVTLLTVNPHFMRAALDNDGLQHFADRVEALTVEIFSEVENL